MLRLFNYAWRGVRALQLVGNDETLVRIICNELGWTCSLMVGPANFKGNCPCPPCCHWYHCTPRSRQINMEPFITAEDNARLGYVTHRVTWPGLVTRHCHGTAWHRLMRCNLTDYTAGTANACRVHVRPFVMIFQQKPLWPYINLICFEMIPQ